MMKNNKQIPVLQFDHKDVSVNAVHTRYRGFFKMNEYQLSHKLYSGKQSEVISREIFERGDAVVVMPYDAKTDTVMMIEQFRPGALRANKTTGTPWMLEFIAGMFNEQESPVDVAIREAQEEANLTINESDLTPIMTYLSSPGGMSECIHLYLASVDSAAVNANVGDVHGLDEEHEDILLHVFSRTEALSLLAQGKITNAATIIALQWLALNFNKLQ
jgi:ADP-ribose pyrophosphatase